MTPSPLITRGMGSNPALVTQGFKVITALVIKVAERVAIIGGRSAKELKRIYDTYTVRAGLATVNGIEKLYPVTKSIRGLVDRSVLFRVNASNPEIQNIRKPNYEILIEVAKVSDGTKNE
jgi:hypothetical protein